MEETLLPKSIALAVFSSDPLSSVAYATQETLLVLAMVGAGALSALIPISLVIAALLTTVVASYRQVCITYPNGGGSYVVSKENLGMYAGLLAAAALLVDYVMTVAVSVVAGVDALVSADPSLATYEVELSIGVIAVIAIANLRGVRESGRIFAVPTYVFVGSILTLVAVGGVKCIGGCPLAQSSSLHLPHQGALTLFILFRAFAAGNTALTGTEAVSNGVPAFRYPQSRNAAATLVIMASLAITMFLGVSALAQFTHVHVTQSSTQTVVAQIAITVFGHGAMFYLIQIATALVLVLAANTAFNGLPRLSAVLAEDQFLPRQFLNFGNRLVYSNGVILLAAIGSVLIWVFQANLTALIQLYLVGVFVAFTLAQFGLVVHWRKVRTRGWRRRALLNGAGGSLTGVVLCIILLTKFTHGAWLVVITVPTLIFLMSTIHRHYRDVSSQLAEPSRAVSTRRPHQQHFLLLIRNVDAASIRAVRYARAFGVSSLAAITFDPSVIDVWRAEVTDVSITMVGRGHPRVGELRRHVRKVRQELPIDDFMTLVTPELFESQSPLQLLRDPFAQRVKAALLLEPHVQVMDVPILRAHIHESAHQSHEPARNDVLVLVNEVHNATLEALRYAESLHANVQGVHFSLSADGGARVGNQWLRSELPYTLEIEDSPFRSLSRSLMEYIRRLEPDGVDRIVTVVLPEFIVPTRRHLLLHGQTALLIKRQLLFERGVVVVSVPYRLNNRREQHDRRDDNAENSGSD